MISNWVLVPGFLVYLVPLCLSFLTTPFQREVGLLIKHWSGRYVFRKASSFSHTLQSYLVDLAWLFPKRDSFLKPQKKRFDSHFSDFWDLYLLIHQYYHVLNFTKKSHECFIAFPSQICVSAHTKTEPVPQGLTPGQGQDEGKANESYKVQNYRRHSPLNVASTCMNLRMSSSSKFCTLGSLPCLPPWDGHHPK